MGKAHSYLVDIVEERPVVHVGIRGRIVRIERTRASFGTIVRIAESAKGTKTGDKEFYLLPSDNDCKDTVFCQNNNVKERIFNIKYYFKVKSTDIGDTQTLPFRARLWRCRAGALCIFFVFL